MKKKITALMLAALLCFNTAGICSAGTISETTSVIFKESTPQTYDTQTEYKNFTLIPGSKTIKISENSLNFSGGGSKTNCCIKFDVTGKCKLSVKFSGTGANERTLVMETESGAKQTQVNTYNTEANASTLSYDYSGNGESIYLYSKNSGISIYSITITYPIIKKGDTDSDGKITDTDAKNVLKHLSDIAPVTAAEILSAMNADGSGSIDLLDAIWILNNRAADPAVTPEGPIDTSDGTEVSSFSALQTALKKSKAKVYITDDIACSERVSLSSGNQSIIGVPKSDGTLPVLDFENMAGETSDIIHNSSGDGDVGIRVSSKNNVIKNLVVEHAHDNGIQIKGSNALNNSVENVILRYNNDSGMQITSGACGTSVKNVFSYRNCDVYTCGGNADGFAVKLGAGPAATSDPSDFQDKGSTFENCFSWENSDDGWDSYDNSGSNYTYKITYTNCMCWSNGLAALHLGYTDYANGLALDEKLPVIQHVKALVSDSVYQSFKTAYNDGTLGPRTMSASDYYKAADNILNVSIPSKSGKYSFANFASKAWGGNPNGFKIGSENSQKISERTFNKCIAFDHTKKGFDKNNSACNIELTDTISFSNNINYQLSGCTARIWENVYGWNGKSGNELPTSGVSASVTKPSDYAQKEAIVREAAQTIISSAAENKFTTANIFDTIF